MALGSGVSMTADVAHPDHGFGWTIDWDLDDDGTTDRTGPTVSLTAAELDDLVCGGTSASGDEHRIRVRVTDSAGVFDEVTPTIRISDQASFTFDVQPRLMQVNPGATGYGYVELGVTDGFDQPVQLAFEDVPTGWTTNITSVQNGPGDVPFTIRPPAGEADDRFDLTLVATSGTKVERRTITVATPFALIPRCEAVITGTVRDAVTGEPLDRVAVHGGNQIAYPGADGVYRTVRQLPVGHVSTVVNMFATRTDYYQTPTVSTRVGCGEEATVDLALAPQDLGTARIRVVEALANPLGDGTAVTATPVAGATVHWSSGGVTREAVTDANGDAELTDVPITSQTAIRSMTVSVSKPGHFQRTSTATYGPDLVADHGTFGLLAQCSITILGGRVVDEHGEPWVGARVARDGQNLLTDADGRYPARERDLSYPNRPITNSFVTARRPDNSSPVSVPLPTIGCGTSVQPDTIVLPRPPEVQKHYATVTGRLVDEDTGQALDGVRVELMTRGFGSRLTATDVDGNFRFDDVQVGEGSIHQTDVWLGVEKYGYYGWNPGIMPFFTVSAGQSPHHELENAADPHRHGPGTGVRPGDGRTPDRLPPQRVPGLPIDLGSAHRQHWLLRAHATPVGAPQRPDSSPGHHRPDRARGEDILLLELAPDAPGSRRGRDP